MTAPTDPQPEVCGTCGHQHTGPDLGGICVGCACGATS